MPGVTYQFRRSLVTRTENFTLTGSMFNWSGGSVPYEDITAVRLYSIPGMQMIGLGTVTPVAWRCRVYTRQGSSIEFASLHFLRPGNFADRSAGFNQFVIALVAQVVENPKTIILAGMPPLIWWSWCITFGALGLILLSSILFCLVGLLSKHLLSLGTGAVLVVLAGMLICPVTFLRALWRRRSRRLDPQGIVAELPVSPE